MLKRTNVITTLTTVISTHTRVISTRRVWFCHSYVLNNTLRVEITLCVMFTRILWWTHAGVQFLYAKCDFNTQSVMNTHRSITSERGVWFLHAECNFHSQCDVETHKCDYECDFSTHKSNFYTQSVIMMRTSVICTGTSWISTRYVWQ
jgi:hypothetical protein